MLYSNKYAECTRRRKPYITTSQAAIDYTYDKLTKELASDKQTRDELFERLAEIQARIARKQRLKDSADKQAKEKLECLVRESVESGKLSSPFALEDLGELELNLGFQGIASPLYQGTKGPTS